MTALRLGMILPSSNTVVEPVACAMVAELDAQVPCSVHFSRFALTAVQVENPAAAYYDSGALLGAAKLLADARCDVICWNGSAGGLVGFERDRRLCAEILAATGIPATTSSLALVEQLRLRKVRRFAMVTLNPAPMNLTIKATFATEGFECIADTHRSDIADNFAMAQVPRSAIATAIRECALARPEAIIVYGTNTRGAEAAAPLSQETDIPVYDSVAFGVIGALRTLNISLSALTSWLPSAQPEAVA